MNGRAPPARLRSRSFRFPTVFHGELEREQADPRVLRRAAAVAGAGIMLALALARAFEPSRAGVLAFCAGCAAAGGHRARRAGELARAGATAVVAFYVTLVASDVVSHAWAWLTAR